MIAFSVPHSEVTCALRSDARDMGSELSESGATRVLGALGSAHSLIAGMSRWLLGLIRCAANRDQPQLITLGQFPVRQTRMVNGIKKKAVEGSTGVP